MRWLARDVGHIHFCEGNALGLVLVGILLSARQLAAGNFGSPDVDPVFIVCALKCRVAFGGSRWRGGGLVRDESLFVG